MNEARELSVRSINEAVGNLSGGATAGGGIVLTFLNDNAQAIGAICTILTLLVFLASKMISGYYERVEHRARLKRIDAGEE